MEADSQTAKGRDSKDARVEDGVLRRGGAARREHLNVQNSQHRANKTILTSSKLTSTSKGADPCRTSAKAKGGIRDDIDKVEATNTAEERRSHDDH